MAARARARRRRVIARRLRGRRGCRIAHRCVTFDVPALSFALFAPFAMKPSLPARAVSKPPIARLPRACAHRPPAAPPPVGAPPPPAARG
nr:hypothetical protein [Burkholderia pseudomallei]